MKKKRLFIGIALMASAFTLASCSSNAISTSNSTAPQGTVTTTPQGTTTTTPAQTTTTTQGNTPTTTTTTPQAGTTTTTTTTTQGGGSNPEPQVIEYDENGEPTTIYNAGKLDLAASNSSASSLLDPSGVNIDGITNNQTTIITDEVYGLEYGSGSVSVKGDVNVNKVSGGYEQAFIEFDEVTNADNYVVEIQGGDYASYTALNSLDETYNNSLYTDFSGESVRTELFGLKAGNYNIRITSVVNGAKSGTPTDCTVKVVSHDRSGYAHFNYTQGVGAYNDDGTMKSNAMVLYVTDQTKNTVTLTHNGTTVTGIGNILNTVGQDCAEAGHEGQCRKVSNGKTLYGTANSNQGILGKLADDNIPLIIRFVGCVSDSGLYKQSSFDASKSSLIEGLTEYNSNNYGGSEGDNGHMARMKSAKNITIEGVGENAILDGWGIHFICEANPQNEKGSSFEVRNLTFMNTPEDALGMEGQQESAKGITGAVQRCWIHHNCFLKPQIANPAESDKSEGDGSCDFKRGRYYTLSYNYFEYCHKTNLIGSSDSSLQFDISVHHNYWYNCGSRITLTRQANVHFYNNYNYCDIRDKNAELSYITSLRANCYIFSEANYFEGCKNVFQTKNGYAKCYENSYVSCFGTLYGGGAQEVTNREDSISNGCKDGNIDLSNFDTDSTLFYYDSSSKKSNCYLTNSTVARNECVKFAGSLYRTTGNHCAAKTNLASNVYTATNAVNVPTDDSKLEITMASSKGSSVNNNVYFNDVTGYTSGTCKFKAQGITFRLTSSAIVTIEYSAGAGGLYEGQIVRDDGRVMLNGDGSATLSAGHTYYVTSTAMDKETTVSYLSFEKYDDASYLAKIKELYASALADIPSTLEPTLECYNKIAKAISLYNSVPDTEKTSLTDPTSKLTDFIAIYKTYAEGKISEIGEVTKDSADKINAASLAVNILSVISPSTTVSNKNVLTQAIASFEGFAITNCIETINNIGDTITLESFEAIQNAIKEYNSLTDENSDSVGAADKITNYEKLQDAISKYVALFNANTVNNLIISANKNDLNSVKAVISAYNGLSSAEKELIAAPKKYANILSANFSLRYNTLPNEDNLQASHSEIIAQAIEAYNLLNSEQKTSFATEYAKILDLKTKVEALGPETVDKLDVTNFYDGTFTVTGASSTSGSVVGKVSTGNTIVVTSKVAVKNISNYSITVTTADKGSTTFKVYTSADGETWTPLEDLKSPGNSGNQKVTGTKTVSTACFIKIEITCSKAASNAKDASLVSLVVNK